MGPNGIFLGPSVEELFREKAQNSDYTNPTFFLAIFIARRVIERRPLTIPSKLSESKMAATCGVPHSGPGSITYSRGSSAVETSSTKRTLTDNPYLLGLAAGMHAKVWYRQLRFEDSMPEDSLTAETFEEFGAVRGAP